MTTTKKTSTKAETTKKAPAAESSSKDAWGATGERTQAINAALLKAKKPLSVKEITEATGAKAVGSHLRTLLGKGYIVKTADGYKVAPKSKK